MARTREFDPNDALEKAMKVFWRKGYADTSIEDLVNATGVSRYGLYDEFESKRGLFLAALDHYQETIVGMVFGTVERPGAALPEVRAYFAKLVELSSTKMGSLGCLMSNCASEVAPYDELVASSVEKFRGRLQLGFARALSNSKDKGELPDEFDVEQAADFLTGVAHGLSVMARSRADPRMIANVVNVALFRLQ